MLVRTLSHAWNPHRSAASRSAASRSAFQHPCLVVQIQDMEASRRDALRAVIVPVPLYTGDGSTCSVSIARICVPSWGMSRDVIVMPLFHCNRCCWLLRGSTRSQGSRRRRWCLRSRRTSNWGHVRVLCVLADSLARTTHDHIVGYDIGRHTPPGPLSGRSITTMSPITVAIKNERSPGGGH